MPDLLPSWTRDAVLALPDDGNRYELVAGELLVTPAQRWLHQDAVGALFLLIAPYARSHRLGHTVMSPADLELRPGDLYQPDLFVVPLIDGRRPRHWGECAAPLLVVEVSSPTTASYDRRVKRPAYQAAGVAEYWIVDLDSRLIERWRPEDERPEIAIETISWEPRGAELPLRIDLGQWFAAVLE